MDKIEVRFSTRGDRSDVENLIQRVRGMIRLGLSFDEIVAHCSDHTPGGEVFLAYQAAKILIKDEDEADKDPGLTGGDPWKTIGT